MINDISMEVRFGDKPNSNRTLGIVIPYRDRSVHLDQFLPYMSKWFSEHKTRGPGRVSAKIIEQEPGDEFNKGRLNNAGYAILRENVDYVCFHDVDYLPIRANYREPESGLAHLVSSPEIVIDPRGVKVTQNRNTFIGGVIVFAKEDFEKINGFSCSYWGWGFEDEDLRMRCALLGVRIERRIGKYHLLPHINSGFNLIGRSVEPTAAHLRNRRLFESRFPSFSVPSKETIDLPSEAVRRKAAKISEDGLSTLGFSVISRAWLIEESNSFSAEKITVSIKDDHKRVAT